MFLSIILISLRFLLLRFFLVILDGFCRTFFVITTCSYFRHQLSVSGILFSFQPITTTFNYSFPIWKLLKLEAKFYHKAQNTKCQNRNMWSITCTLLQQHKKLLQHLHSYFSNPNTALPHHRPEKIKSSNYGATQLYT